MLHSAILNTAFTELSNAMCKDEATPQPTIPAMHDSMVRLYTAAKLIKKVEGQSALAAALSETPQVVNNWETRGISAAGALKAQAKIGCDANWLVRGVGAMLPEWPFPKIPFERFNNLDPGDRGHIQWVLLEAIEKCEKNTDTHTESSGIEQRPSVVSNPPGFQLTLGRDERRKSLHQPAKKGARKGKG